MPVPPGRLVGRHLARAVDGVSASLSPLDSRQIPPSSRDNNNNNNNKKGSTTIIIAVVFASIVVFIAGLIIFKSYCRRGRGRRFQRDQSARNSSASGASLQKSTSADPEPAWYKRLFRRSPHAYHQTENDDGTARFSRRLQDMLEESLEEAQAREAAEAASHNPRGSSGTVAGNVGRNTSVRSVMTLPMYRPAPTDSERVLGREGERDGVDIVVVLPTAETEEALREEEMDALYQMRVARRRQIAEREERRRLRRDARDAHDVIALGALRSEARDATTRNTTEIEELRRDHERIKASRHRAVSSVSYADVGVVRADGTRVRDSSTDAMMVEAGGLNRVMSAAGGAAESMGLLSDAASVGTAGSRSLFHRRDRSGSSVTAGARLSIDTARSNERFSHAGGGRDSVASNAAGRTPPADLSARSRANSRAGSSPEVIDRADAEIDLGDTHMAPPGYDEVSLDDITPVHSRGSYVSVASATSQQGSPAHWNEPPPEYPGSPARARNTRLSAHMEDLAAEVVTTHSDGDRGGSASGSSSPGSDGRRGSPRSLARLQTHETVPEIVIQPSSALPMEDRPETHR